MLAHYKRGSRIESGMTTQELADRTSRWRRNQGQASILDIQPGKLHASVSVILGSKNEVERVTSYHAKKSAGL